MSEWVLCVLRVILLLFRRRTYFEIDIWLPELNLGIEQQDKSHYTSAWFVNSSLDLYLLIYKLVSPVVKIEGVRQNWNCSSEYKIKLLASFAWHCLPRPSDFNLTNHPNFDDSQNGHLLLPFQFLRKKKHHPTSSPNALHPALTPYVRPSHFTYGPTTLRTALPPYVRPYHFTFGPTALRPTLPPNVWPSTFVFEQILFDKIWVSSKKITKSRRWWKVSEKHL